MLCRQDQRTEAVSSALPAKTATSLAISFEPGLALCARARRRAYQVPVPVAGSRKPEQTQSRRGNERSSFPACTLSLSRNGRDGDSRAAAVCQGAPCAAAAVLVVSRILTNEHLPPQANIAAGRPAARNAAPRAAARGRRAVTKAQSKDITYDQDSRAKIQRGIDKLADAVGVTLGPRGGSADCAPAVRLFAGGERRRGKYIFSDILS